MLTMLLRRVPQAQAKPARCSRLLPWCAVQHSPKAQHLPTTLVRNTTSTSTGPTRSLQKLVAVA
jgi:hypothetical protein